MAMADAVQEVKEPLEVRKRRQKKKPVEEKQEEADAVTIPRAEYPKLTVMRARWTDMEKRLTAVERAHKRTSTAEEEGDPQRRIATEDDHYYRDTGRKVNASLAFTVPRKTSNTTTSKSSNSSKSGRHHSLVGAVTNPVFMSRSTRDNRRPATLLKEREFSPAGRRRSPSFRSRTCRENSS